jgi:hypothetical protein
MEIRHMSENDELEFENPLEEDVEAIEVGSDRSAIISSCVGAIDFREKAAC